MELKFKIGPAIISLTADRDAMDWPQVTYREFQYTGKKPPDLTIQIKDDSVPSRKEAVLVSESETQWQLFREKDAYQLEFLEQVHCQPRMVARISPALDRMDLHQIRVPYLCEHPRNTWAVAEAMNSVVQWWLTGWAAYKDRGLLVHAAAVAWRERGLVFCGPSGSGKTTMAGFWGDDPETVVLNDERVFIWCDGTRWMVSGTPWSGMLAQASSASVPLARIFLLKKGLINRSNLLPKPSFFAGIFQEVFVPLWDQNRMANLIGICERLLNEVEGSELEFVKGLSAVEYVKEIASRRLRQAALAGAA